jgi:hypothetical protein
VKYRGVLLVAIGFVFGLILSAQAQGPEDRDMILVEPCETSAGRGLGDGHIASCKARVQHLDDGQGTIQSFAPLGCGAQHLVEFDDAVGLAHVTVWCVDKFDQPGLQTQKHRELTGDPIAAPGLLD